YGLAIFERLAQDSQLRGLETEAFVAKLSQVQSELFAWHPFREGNTRSTTTFVSLLARQAGWSIAWRDADPAEMQQRIRASFRAPERVAGRELEALLGSIISPNPR
ncbi:MAG: Fic/DOC family protein, partial [Acidimicrobiales bacterium]